MDKVLFYVILVVALVAIGPLLTIWAFNTLFPVLNIPYSFDTWAATVLIGGFIRANVTVKT
jgi:hypothetical protein